MTNKELKEKLIGLAGEHGLTTIVNKIKDYKKANYETKVAFLGEFSSGKTTLVNSLIKKRFLPMFDKPTTAIVTEIRKGSETKFEVISYEEDELVREIEPAELAQEVQKTRVNSKIRISLADNDLIDEQTVLIDTPGVASINQTHSEVTYGYIPNVDVALVIINCNMGSVSKSLLQFINQYPKHIKARIKFVLTHIDTKSDLEIENIKKEFYSALAEVIAEPEIYLVSSKQALVANQTNDSELFEKSGVKAIEQLIKKDIPAYKLEIQLEREKEFLLSIAQELILCLEEIYSSLSLDTDELVEKEKHLLNEKSKLIKEIDKLQKRVEAAEENSLSKTKYAAISAGGAVLQELINGQDISEAVLAYIEEVQGILATELQQFDFFNSQNQTNSLIHEISSGINLQLNPIVKRGQGVATILNHALVAFIAPGAGLAGNAAEMAGSAVIKQALKGAAVNTVKGVLAAGAQAAVNTTIASITNKTTEEKDSSSKDGKSEIYEKNELSKTQKFAAAASAIVGQFNLIGKGADWALNKTLNEKATKLLLVPTKRQINAVFIALRNDLDEVIEQNFRLPIQAKIEAINNIRAKEADAMKDLKKNKENLRTKIQYLKTL